MSNQNLCLLFLRGRVEEGLHFHRVDSSDVWHITHPKIRDLIAGELTDPCPVSRIYTNIVPAKDPHSGFVCRTALPDGRPLRVIDESVIRALAMNPMVNAELSEDDWDNFWYA